MSILLHVRWSSSSNDKVMLIAITGGIGSGKSVVSQLLRTMGYHVYDCDVRAKWVMTHDPVLRQQLTDLFGADTYLPDLSLNKPYLSSRIFGDPTSLAQMNACVHPAVNRDLQQQYKQLCPHPADRFFFESAILFESGFDQLSHPDQVWTVSAPLEMRIANAMRRDHASRQQILARMESQIAQEEKEKRSDVIVYNDMEHSLIKQISDLL